MRPMNNTAPVIPLDRAQEMQAGNMATPWTLSLTSELSTVRSSSCRNAEIRSDDEYGQAVQTSAYMAPQQSTSTVDVNAFGRSTRAREVSQPLAQSGAIPAGFEGPEDDMKYHPPAGKGYANGSDPFDDDEAGPSAYSFAAPGTGPYSAQRKRGRWRRIREDYLTDVDWTFGLNRLLRRRSRFDGVPREVALNDPEANRLKGFENNAVSTGKYGPITFLPQFLFCT